MKKKLCIVHIGMHKTGSSSIQNTLFQNLNDPYFHYANLGVANHSAAIYSMFADVPENYHAHIARKLSKDEVTEYNSKNKKMLIDSFNTIDATVTAIISGEDIGYLNVNELMRLKKFLDIYFYSIEIIVYIRPPISYIQSAFQELVKHGLRRFDFTHCDPNYSRFQIFENIFGRDQIIFRPFDIKKLYHNDIVMDFYHTLSISIHRDYKQVKDNESISLEALSLLYIYQKYINDFTYGKNIFNERKNLIKILSQIGESRLKFSKDVLKSVLQSNEEGLYFLEEQMGESLLDSTPDVESNVNEEKDLLYVGQSVIEELRKLIDNEEVCSKIDTDSPEEVAKLVDILKNKDI